MLPLLLFCQISHIIVFLIMRCFAMSYAAHFLKKMLEDLLRSLQSVNGSIFSHYEKTYMTLPLRLIIAVHRI